MLSRDIKIAVVAFLAGAGVVVALLSIDVYLINSRAREEARAARSALLDLAEEDEWVTAKGELFPPVGEMEPFPADSVVGYVLDGEAYTPDERHCGYLYVAESATLPFSGDLGDLTVWLVSIHKAEVSEFKPADLLGSRVRCNGTLGEQEEDSELKGAKVVRFSNASWEVLTAKALGASERLILMARITREMPAVDPDPKERGPVKIESGWVSVGDTVAVSGMGDSGQVEVYSISLWRSAAMLSGSPDPLTGSYVAGKVSHGTMAKVIDIDTETVPERVMVKIRPVGGGSVGWLSELFIIPPK